MPAQRSTVIRRQLGQRLRWMREQAGRTIADVEEARVFSTSKVFRIESGHGRLNVADVWALCRFYGADTEVASSLARLAEWEETDGWARLPPDWFWVYRQLEGSCRALSTWQPELVHGLFQTDAYARLAVAFDGAPEDV